MKKKTAIIFALTAMLAISTLSLTIVAAMPTSNPGMKFASMPVQKSWIRINGIITKWGEQDAKGLLQTQARTALLPNSDTRQLASASAVWTTNISRPIQTIKAKENFTYTFYAARLLNASVSKLSASSSSSNYFLNGTWTVLTITSNVTILTDDGGNITRVIRNTETTGVKAYGELTVTDNWTKFTLAIDGIDPLTGSVFRSMTRQMQFNPFKITEESDVVTRADLKEVVRCFRAMPGWGSYDTRMDFNNNYKIDIADLSTVASNM